MHAAIAATQERSERRIVERQLRAALDEHTAPAWLLMPGARFFWLVSGTNHLGRLELNENDPTVARDHLVFNVNGSAVSVARVRGRTFFLLLLLFYQRTAFIFSSWGMRLRICVATTVMKQR